MEGDDDEKEREETEDGDAATRAATAGSMWAASLATASRRTYQAAKMRALLRPLASAAARNPIEVIVLGFIAATLAYFHVLDAIRESTFLSPAIPTSLRPAHALFRDSQWAAVPENVWSADGNEERLELQQVVFGLDSSVRRRKSYTDGELTFGDLKLKDALQNATVRLSEHTAVHFLSTGERSATLTLALPMQSA